MRNKTAKKKDARLHFTYEKHSEKQTILKQFSKKALQNLDGEGPDKSQYMIDIGLR